MNKHGVVFINGKKQKDLENMQYKYIIRTKGRSLNPTKMQKFGVSNEDLNASRINNDEYILPLTMEVMNKVKKFKSVVSVTRMENTSGVYAPYIYPHSENYKWNEDNFGPLYIPKKGATVTIVLLCQNHTLPCKSASRP